jgi:hypothetical protein
VPFGTALPALLGESQDGDLYVDPVNGSDANNGLTTGTAKATIGGAYAILVNGQGKNINLRNTGLHDDGGSPLDEVFPVGVYGPSAANPITIRTYPPDLTSATGLPGTRGEAVIRGRLQFNPGDLKQQNYNGGAGFNLRVQNIEMRDTTGSGVNGIDAIKANNVQNFEVSGCYIHDIAGQGVIIRGAGRTTTLNGAITSGALSLVVNSNTNFVEATPFYAVIGGGNGVEIVLVTNVSGTTWTIERGQLGTDAAAHNNAVTVEGYWRCKNAQVFNCVIGDCGDGSEWSISHAHPIYWGSDNGFVSGEGGAVYNCILYNSDPLIGGAYGLNCYEQGDDCIFANVTVYGMRRGGITLSGEKVHATDDSTWKNLIVTDIGTDSPGPGYAFDSFFTGPFGPGSGNLVDSSLWFNCFDDHRTGADVLGITFSNLTNADPLFFNAANLDFRIPQTSPAVGIGDEAYTPVTDIRGVARVTADLGALASEVSASSPFSRVKLGLGLGL